jgi:LysR family glycine cleavage system transcriptional activator
MAARNNPPLIAARTFEAAARHRSFLKAADELNVTPTAVSHQVRRLEEYMGEALFVRLNRSVELTAAGAALAKTLKDLFIRLEKVLEPASQRQRSIITISAMQSLAAKWLAPRLPDFEARNPQWQLRLDVDDGLSDFESGAVDLALRYGRGKSPGLHSRFWMDATVFPVCSAELLKRLPLAKPADLRRHTLIHSHTQDIRNSPPSWKIWLEAVGVSKVNAERGPQFSNIYMALEAAEAGHGVALAPAPLVERELANGRLVRPLEMAVPNPYSFWIVCPPQNLQDARIKALTTWLLEQVPPVQS